MSISPQKSEDVHAWLRRRQSISEKLGRNTSDFDAVSGELSPRQTQPWFKVATGTGMAGYDSTIPAPIPVDPRPRVSSLAYRGRNAPHPRERRVPGTHRGLHGDLQIELNGVGRL
jgi:hypothetical protein